MLVLGYVLVLGVLSLMQTLFLDNIMQRSICIEIMLNKYK